MYSKEILDAFEDDKLSISQIAKHFGLTRDVIQRARARHRASVGFKPLNRAGKSGFGSN